MNANEFQFPQYEEIDARIREARLERSVYVAEMVSNLVLRAGRALKGFGARFAEGLAAENDRRAVEADAFLRRSVGPRY
jgi:hypothetical protein